MDDATKNLLARVHGLQLANKFFGEQIEEIRRQMVSPEVGRFVERRMEIRRSSERTLSTLPDGYAKSLYQLMLMTRDDARAKRAGREHSRRADRRK